MSQSKFRIIDIVISIVILIALPFVFFPELMSNKLEQVFKYFVLIVVTIYIVLEVKKFFKKS